MKKKKAKADKKLLLSTEKVRDLRPAADSELQQAEGGRLPEDSCRTTLCSIFSPVN